MFCLLNGNIYISMKEISKANYDHGSVIAVVDNPLGHAPRPMPAMFGFLLCLVWLWCAYPTRVKCKTPLVAAQAAK